MANSAISTSEAGKRLGAPIWIIDTLLEKGVLTDVKERNADAKKHFAKIDPSQVAKLKKVYNYKRAGKITNKHAAELKHAMNTAIPPAPRKVPSAHAPALAQRAPETAPSLGINTRLIHIEEMLAKLLALWS